MKIALSILVLWLLAVKGFRVFQFERFQTKLWSQSPGQIDICAKGIELSPALREKVEQKIGKATKYMLPSITSINVKLKGPSIPSTESHSHMKMDAMIAEVTVGFKGGGVIHVHQQSDHMYSSIDLVAHKLKRAVNRRHEKMINIPIRRARREKMMEDDELYFNSIEDDLEWTANIDDEDDGQDEEDGLSKEEENLLVVREKHFAMTPMSVEEATLALDFIQHPFYVFRNKDTNEVNVVYRRNSGGFGHIVPDASKE